MRELLCSNALTPRDDKEKVSEYTPIWNNGLVNIHVLCIVHWAVPLLDYGKQNNKRWMTIIQDHIRQADYEGTALL